MFKWFAQVVRAACWVWRLQAKLGAKFTENIKMLKQIWNTKIKKINIYTKLPVLRVFQCEREPWGQSAHCSQIIGGKFQFFSLRILTFFLCLRFCVSVLLGTWDLFKEKFTLSSHIYGVQAQNITMCQTVKFDTHGVKGLKTLCIRSSKCDTLGL